MDAYSVSNGYVQGLEMCATVVIDAYRVSDGRYH